MSDAASPARTPAPALDADRFVIPGLALAVVLPLVCFVVVPLVGILKLSFVAPDGIGLGNFIRYFDDPKFGRIVLNSFAVSAVSHSRSSSVTIVQQASTCSRSSRRPIHVTGFLTGSASLRLRSPIATVSMRGL